MSEPPLRLRRSLGLAGLIFYGVGDILGAGIYALIGVIAGVAGRQAWQSFGVAMVVAAFTALSYAELVRRFPRSSGEAFYLERAFQKPGLALLIGWLSFASGIVSMATASRAFADYLIPPLTEFTRIKELWLPSASMCLFILLAASITFWGIRQSSIANIVCTLVEATGLVIVIVVGAYYLSQTQPAAVPAVALPDKATWVQVAQGGALAFFAFIGFEDLVKVSEEAKRPKRDMPIAILCALAAAGCLYIAIAWMATAVVPVGQLAESKGPLMAVIHRAAPGFPIWLFSLIALMAIANTGLLNFVMASRLLYGMARQRLLPAWLGAIYPPTQTPHWSILSILIIVLVLALSGSLAFLAGTTSVLLLAVFFSVHLSLLAIKFKGPVTESGFRVPWPVPLIGAITCVALVLFVPLTSVVTATGVLGVGLVIVGVHWWKRRGRQMPGP